MRGTTAPQPRMKWPGFKGLLFLVLGELRLDSNIDSVTSNYTFIEHHRNIQKIQNIALKVTQLCIIQ